LVLDKATLLDLRALSWVAYGRFTLTCEDPDGSTDAWWSDREGWRKVRIISSDRDQVFGEVEVELEAVSDWMPEGRMAFTFKNRSLPPGKYKVIPWPDAPAKYCRTFEVQSGQHTEVVVRGG
jgi:hypothetical protein